VGCQNTCLIIASKKLFHELNQLLPNLLKQRLILEDLLGRAVYLSCPEINVSNSLHALMKGSLVKALLVIIKYSHRNLKDFTISTEATCLQVVVDKVQDFLVLETAHWRGQQILHRFGSILWGSRISQRRCPWQDYSSPCLIRCIRKLLRAWEINRRGWVRPDACFALLGPCLRLVILSTVSLVVALLSTHRAFWGLSLLCKSVLGAYITLPNLHLTRLVAHGAS